MRCGCANICRWNSTLRNLLLNRAQRNSAISRRINIRLCWHGERPSTALNCITNCPFHLRRINCATLNVSFKTLHNHDRLSIRRSRLSAIPFRIKLCIKSSKSLSCTWQKQKFVRWSLTNTNSVRGRGAQKTWWIVSNETQKIFLPIWKLSSEAILSARACRRNGECQGRDSNWRIVYASSDLPSILEGIPRTENEPREKCFIDFPPSSARSFQVQRTTWWRRYKASPNDLFMELERIGARSKNIRFSRPGAASR